MNSTQEIESTSKEVSEALVDKALVDKALSNEDKLETDPVKAIVLASPISLKESCTNQKYTRVFLGGSISDTNWQADVSQRLSDLPVYIFNPCQVNCFHSDEIIKQTEIEWGIEAQFNSDVSIYYFDPLYISPAALLEFGLFSRSNNNIVVYCPPDYLYHLNVEIVCRATGIPFFPTADETIARLRKEIIMSNEQLLEKMKKRDEMLTKLLGSDGKILDNEDLVALMGMMGMADGRMGNGSCVEKFCSEDEDEKVDTPTLMLEKKDEDKNEDEE